MKRIVALFLLVSMIFVLFAGCGKADTAGSAAAESISADSGDSGDSSEESSDSVNDAEGESDTSGSDSDSGDNDSDSASAAKFMDLSKAQATLGTFKEFGYEYRTNSDGTETFLSFGYTSLGSETIDGVNTEHLKVTTVEKDKTTEYEGWFNQEWEAVKFKNSEGEKSGSDAAMAAMSLRMLTQMYSNLSKVNSTLLKEDLTVDEDMYELKGPVKESVDFGSGNTDVEKYELSAKIGSTNKIISVAKINGMNLYTSMESVKDNVTTDSMKLVRAVLR